MLAFLGERTYRLLGTGTETWTMDTTCMGAGWGRDEGEGRREELKYLGGAWGRGQAGMG
jgi:hypothetical protein